MFYIQSYLMNQKAPNIDSVLWVTVYNIDSTPSQATPWLNWITCFTWIQFNHPNHYFCYARVKDVTADAGRSTTHITVERDSSVLICIVPIWFRHIIFIYTPHEATLSATYKYYVISGESGVPWSSIWVLPQQPRPCHQRTVRKRCIGKGLNGQLIP